MGKPNKESLQHRILNRNPEDVTPEDAALADEYIKPHNLQQCREASTGTATFYRWVSNSYTYAMVCSHMRGLFSIMTGNLVFTYINVYLAHYEIFHAKLVREASVLIKGYCPISDQ